MRRRFCIISFALVFCTNLVACDQTISTNGSQNITEQESQATDDCRPIIGVALAQSTAEDAARLNERGRHDFIWPDDEGVVVVKTLNPMGDIQAGDLILEAAGQPIAETIDFIKIIQSSEVGQLLPLLIQRKEETLTVEVKVQANPRCE